MSNSEDWSFANRLKSAMGLLFIAAIFGALVWWLGRGTAAASTDLETFKNNSRGARGVTQAMGVFGVGTFITGGIAALSLIGAVFVIWMKGPEPEE